MARRLTRRLAVAALVGLILTACGVPTQEHPQRINRGDIPFGLLETSKGSASTTTTRP